MMYPGAPMGWNAAGTSTGLAMAPSWGAKVGGMVPLGLMLGGASLASYGLSGQRTAAKSLTGIAGMGALGGGLGLMSGIAGFGPLGMQAGLGAGMMIDAWKRGGWYGVAGGALGGMISGAAIGTMIMPGIGTAIGMGVGALVGGIGGLIKKFRESTEEKLHKKIRELYNVDVADKGILKYIIEAAKSTFGGNLDVAIRSPQIRDMIQLYGMTVGQRGTGFPAQMQSLTFQQAGGRLYEVPVYSGGVQLPSVTAVAAPIIINQTTILDPTATTNFWETQTLRTVIANPRAISTANIRSNNQNFGRRRQAAQMLAPELVTQ